MPNISAGHRKILALLSLAAIALYFAGCSDDRKVPLVPGTPSYSETIVLLDSVVANGALLSPSFRPRGQVVDARLYITGLLKADAGLILYNDLNADSDSLNQIILRLSGAILDIELKPDSLKTREDSLALDSLRALRGVNEGLKAGLQPVIDSLDTRLDDRYSVKVRLDNDATDLMPRAIILTDASVPAQLNAGETAVWGQGYYNAEPNAYGVIGKTMRLSLSRFWVADQTFIPSGKPSRPTNPDGLPELFPITDWLGRLTPGTDHRLHIRFGQPATDTRLTVTLYLVYQTIPG